LTASFEVIISYTFITEFPNIRNSKHFLGKGKHIATACERKTPTISSQELVSPVPIESERNYERIKHYKQGIVPGMRSLAIR
jgi:UDP-galactopyranose mutase